MKKAPEPAEVAETIADLRRVIAWMDLALSRLREGIVVVNEDELLIGYANDAFAAMAGRPRIFLLGAPIDKFLPALPGSIQGSPSTFHDVLAGRKVEVEFSRLRFGRQAILVVRGL